MTFEERVESQGQMITMLLDEVRSNEEKIAQLEEKIETYRAYIDTAAGCASCPR